MRFLVVALLGVLCASASALHGGTFPPPPPADGGGNANPPSGPATGPRPSDPRPPAPKGPSTGIPGATGQPAPTPSPTGARTPAVPVSTALTAGEDPTSWQVWWRYNRDVWLDLKARVDARAPATLGQSGGLDPRQAAGIEAAYAALERETQRDLVSGLIVALARSADDGPAAEARACARRITPFVANPDQEIGETAAAALGILRQPGPLADLAGLLHDDERGRALARGRVSQRTRAFAAYGLALAAARAERDDLSAFVAHHVGRALVESRHSPDQDLQAACVLALGVAPLPSGDGEGALPARGPLAGFAPRTRAAQAALLLDVLRDEARPTRVQAHAPDALARLGVGASDDLRASIARELAQIAADERRADASVARGAVLALGRLADCDEDAADVRMRAALQRALASGDALSRHFALVALAQVAGRPGSAEDPAPVQADVRDTLLARLARGKNRERAWAALGLGILERARLARGAEPSPAVRAALRRALADAGSVEQLGAAAIGLGLAQDRGAARDLLARFADVQDPVARGHLALALGLVGATEAAAPLRAVLSKSRFQPELLREVAIALALLSDPGVENALVLELAQARSLSAQAGIARAIGWAGSLDSVAPLVRMLEDAAHTSGARAYSAVALGLVLDRERLPWNAFLSAGVNYPSAPASLTDGSAGILDLL